MEDLQRGFMPRAETEVLLRALEAKLEVVSKEVNEGRDRKTGAVQGWGWAVGVIGLVALAVAIAKSI